jgi:hypothetical protein
MPTGNHVKTEKFIFLVFPWRKEISGRVFVEVSKTNSKYYSEVFLKSKSSSVIEKAVLASMIE